MEMIVIPQVNHLKDELKPLTHPWAAGDFPRTTGWTVTLQASGHAVDQTHLIEIISIDVCPLDM